MKFGHIGLVFSLFLSTSAFAQSGRNKPSEPETGSASPSKTSVVYQPTQSSPAPPRPAATPTKIAEESGVVRVESTLVPIPVAVFDSRGRLVSDLKLDDFELKIDGSRAVVSELFTSEAPVRIAMLFDNSGSVEVAREFEKKAAIRFFDRVIRTQKDLACLYSVSTVTRLEQRFTADIDLLKRSINFFPPPVGATALLDGVVLATKYLTETNGRRVIVILSDGDDTSSDATLEDVLKELQLTNTQVYVVQTTDFENYKRTGKRGGNANIRKLAAERRMIEVAKQTGGRVYSPLDEGELDEAFAQISAELSQQYILGYYPEDDLGSPGAFKEISLSIKNRPKTDVRTRKGYLVPKK